MDDAINIITALSPAKHCCTAVHHQSHQHKRTDEPTNQPATLRTPVSMTEFVPKTFAVFARVIKLPPQNLSRSLKKLPLEAVVHWSAFLFFILFFYPQKTRVKTARHFSPSESTLEPRPNVFSKLIGTPLI